MLDDGDEIVRWYSTKFARRTGIELEELEQEARQAYWYAKSCSSYDPRKSAFRTFASTCVQNHLSSYAWAYQKKHPAITEPLENYLDLPAADPSPEDVTYWRELVNQLPDDALLIVNLVLEMDGVPAHRMKIVVRTTLDWSGARIDRAFQAIHGMLRQHAIA